MEFLGAHLSTDARREYAFLSTELLTSRWDAAMEIMADVAANSSFPTGDLDRVRRDRLTDLRRVSDSPATIAARAYRALVFGPGTTYGHPLTGTEASVEGLARDELVGHFAKHYGPANVTLLVVGDVSQEEAVATAEKHFGGWTSGAKATPVFAGGEVPGPTPATIYLADKPGAAQSIIRAGHLTVPRKHDDYFALNLVNYIFGGQFSARLNMNLRQDKGYSYGYTSSIDWSTGPSAMYAGGGVQTAVTKDAVAETLREFAAIRGGRPVTQEEFTDAVDGSLRGLPASFETHSQTLSQVTRMVAFGLPEDYFVDYAANLQRVTLDDAHRVAKERIDDGALKVLVVGDREVIEAGLREIGLPVVLVDYEGRGI